MGSVGEVALFVAPYLAEIDFGEFGGEALVFFLGDFDIGHLVVLGIKCGQERHAAYLFTMLPDPLHHFKHLIGAVGDGHGWVVLGPEEFILQPELTLLDGTDIATGNGAFRCLHGEVDDPGGSIVHILAVFRVHRDASIAQHFVDGGVDRHAHVADVVWRPTGVQTTGTIQQLRRVTTGLDTGNRCRLVNSQRGSSHAIDFD